MFFKDSFKKLIPSSKIEKRPSVRLQILIVATTLAAVTVVFSLSSRNQRELLQLAAEQFNQQQLILARSAATGIEQFIVDVSTELFILSNFPVIQSMGSGILEQMKVIHKEVPLQTSLRRLDKNGILRFIYPNEGWRKELVGRDYSGEVYFQKVKETGKVFFSGSIINEMGQRRMRVARPIYSKGEEGVKEFSGIMIWSVDPEALGSLYLSPIVSGETGFSWLLNEEGIFLSHHEEEFVGRNAFKVRAQTNPEFSYDTINNIQRQMMSGEEGVGRYVSGWHRGQSGKIEKLIAYAPVRVFDKVWSVAVCAPVTEVERITKKARYNELYTMGFIGLILTAAGAIFFIAFYRWSQSLKQEIEVRKQTEKRIVHLNSILKVIRNVNQLIVKEKDREKLLQGACDTLIEAREYQSAWIVLIKENGSFVISAQAGIKTGFSAMIDKLKSGEMTWCIREVIEQSGVAVVANSAVECGDCPLAMSCINRIRMVARLKYKNCFYGFFAVIVPLGMIIDEEEQSLFDEVAGDISFALYAIEVEAERRQAEEALKELQQYTRELIEVNPDVLVTISAEGKITDVNHATEIITGISGKELIGTDFSSYFTDSAMARKGYQQVFRDGYVRDYPLEIKHRNGNVTPVLYNASVYKDTQGRITGIFAAARDITEAKKEEKKLQEAYTKLEQTQTQLIQAEKMEAIGRMASGIAHEVKNPLGIIAQGIYFLETKLTGGPKDSQEVLRIVKSSIKRADNIINALVDFSKTSEVELKSEDINSVLEDSVTLIQHRIELQKRKIVKELGKSLPKVLIDKRRMEQVFINLLLNASQAIPGGGKLFIRSYLTRLNKSNNRMSGKDIGGFKFGENAVGVEIEDTGVGIPEKNLDKVFEPFFTTKRLGGGTGLGLSVTKNIIDIHKGLIEITSKINKGTKVIVILKTANREDKNG